MTKTRDGNLQRNSSMKSHAMFVSSELERLFCAVRKKNSMEELNYAFKEATDLVGGPLTMYSKNIHTLFS